MKLGVIFVSKYLFICSGHRGGQINVFQRLPEEIEISSNGQVIDGLSGWVSSGINSARLILYARNIENKKHCEEIQVSSNVDCHRRILNRAFSILSF